MSGAMTRAMSGRGTRRAGFSLVELTVALALFSILMAISLAFYRQQGRAFTEGNRRMALMQNLRYGVNLVEENLRTAGVNVPTKQPVLVYADTNVIAFNADFASNIPDDFFAVHHDHRLPDDAVVALTRPRRFTLPGTSFVYPDSSYSLGSGNSPAETILFYFAPDTATARSDDWVLYRQVNDLAADPVARHLLRTDAAFFTYYVPGDDGSGSAIRELPRSSPPGAHAAPIHGSLADTGDGALVDSVRAVRVTYAATNALPGARESVRRISRLIRLPNAGLASQPNCGNRPILGSAVMAGGVAATATTPGHIRLEWARATDEATGEQDVLRYVLWRRVGDTGGWGNPIASVPPGLSSYVYRDFDAAPGVGYSYALAAQDCTPRYSPAAISGLAAWSEGT